MSQQKVKQIFTSNVIPTFLADNEVSCLILPKELWRVHICSNLDKINLSNLRLVCRWFHQEIIVFPLWKQKCSLQSYSTYIKKIEDFHWKKPPIYKLYYSFFEDYKILDFPFPSELQELIFSGIPSLFDKNLIGLPSSLTTLNLANVSFVSNESLKYLPSSLTDLDLTCCNQITNVGVSALKNLPLKKLRLTSCYLVSSEGIKNLPPTLEFLDLYYCNVTSSILKYLPPNLKLIFRFSKMEVTPLIMAIFDGDFELVDYLIKKGADVNLPCSKCAPLFLACERREYEIIELLLRNKANPNQISFSDKTPPIYIACYNNYIDIVQLLVKYGANVNERRMDTGSTPLYIACQEGHSEVIKLLLQHGADVNMYRTQDGSSPLYIAAQNGKFSCVQLLVEHGSNVNYSRTLDSCTALYIACQNNHLEVVDFLLLHKADPNIICYEVSEFLQKNSTDTILDKKIYSFTSLYISWWMGQNACIYKVLPYSNLKLNVKLAKLNGHDKALKFFNQLYKLK